MESFSQVSQWLEYLKTKSRVQVVRQRWPKLWNIDLHDFEVQFKFCEHLVVGRGTSVNPRLAVIKAAAEAIERATCVANNLSSSNGVAAHFEHSSAAEAASNEWLERQMFKDAIEGQSHFAKVNIETSLTKTLSRVGVEVELYRFAEDRTRFFILAFLKSSKALPVGLTIGFGSSDQLNSAAEKAIIEALRTKAWLAFDPPAPSTQLASDETFKSPWSDSAKLAIGTHSLNAKRLIALVEENSLPKQTKSPLLWTNLSIEDLHIPGECAVDFPFFVCRAVYG